MLDSTYFQECELVNDDFPPDSALKVMEHLLGMIRCVRAFVLCIYVRVVVQHVFKF